MKSKDYQKPTMRIVKLQHRTQLLTGSGFGATRDDYGRDRTDGGTGSGDEVWGN